MLSMNGADDRLADLLFFVYTRAPGVFRLNHPSGFDTYVELYDFFLARCADRHHEDGVRWVLQHPVEASEEFESFHRDLDHLLARYRLFHSYEGTDGHRPRGSAKGGFSCVD